MIITREHAPEWARFTARKPHPLADRKARGRYNRALRSRGVPAKSCSHCYAVKALSQFNKNSGKPDGRESRCRECHRAANAQWYAENTERQRAYAAWYHKEYAEKRRAYVARWYAEHTEERRAYMVRYRAENPDKERAKERRRRARLHGADNDGWTDSDIARRAEECDAYGCFWCGSDPGEDWHRDHIVPLSRGGSNRLENIAISCQPCNSSKWAKIPYEEWTPPLAEEPA
ncbi:HNH endonuclease [Streptomyces megasporus]|uniref:HNH endonuclease n=1 Tax=Streptomyces megasporus TaxID=44060 RepID=UPI0012FF2FC1|nr:HNH endonuclease [Streptomyces megasporus]